MSPTVLIDTINQVRYHLMSHDEQITDVSAGAAGHLVISMSCNFRALPGQRLDNIEYYDEQHGLRLSNDGMSFKFKEI